MVVLVVTACPAGLRGHLTRWLLEISPGVFVGHVSARVREDLWFQVIELCKDGKAILSTRRAQSSDWRFGLIGTTGTSSTWKECPSYGGRQTLVPETWGRGPGGATPQSGGALRESD